MTKLTLSVDAETVARAKLYAQARGTSVSALVQNYLDAVTKPRKPETTEPPRVLRALRGSIGNADPEDYRQHLETKYRTKATQ